MLANSIQYQYNKLQLTPASKYTSKLTADFNNMLICLRNWAWGSTGSTLKLL